MKLTSDQMAVLFGQNWEALRQGGSVPTDGLVGQAWSKADATGNFSAAYQQLYIYMTQSLDATLDVPVNTDQPAPGVERSAWLWVQAAAQANGDDGSYGSYLIRNYTKAQVRLRYGAELADAKVNQASNNVARNVFKNILALGCETPTIYDIEKYDATAVGQDVFGGDNTAWSGTILFPYLGTGNFYEALVLKNPGKVPPGDELTPVDPPAQTDTYDLVSILQALPPLRPTVLQGFGAKARLEYTLAQNRLGTAGTNALLQALARDTDTYLNGFYGLTGQDTFSVGARLFPTSLSEQADYWFNGFGVSAAVGRFSGTGPRPTLFVDGSVRNLVNAGPGDDTVSVSGSPPPQDPENPVIHPVPGTSVLDGGGGGNTLRYDTGADIRLKVTYEGLPPPQPDGYPSALPDAPAGRLRVSKLSTAQGSTTDFAYRFQEVILGDGDDTVTLGKDAEGGLKLTKDSAVASIDGGKGINGLDLSGLTKPVVIKGDRLQNLDLQLKNFEALKGNDAGDTITGSTQFKQIDLGDGSNYIKDLSGPVLPGHESEGARGRWVRVDLGSGTSTVGGGLAPGSDVYLGAGHVGDQIEISPDTEVHGLNPTDHLTWAGITLHAALRYAASDDPWGYTLGGLIRMGLNSRGELAIQTIAQRVTAALDGFAVDPTSWVAGFDQAFGGGQPTAGIHLAEITSRVMRWTDPRLPAGYSAENIRITGGLIPKAAYNMETWGGVDPLVLDLGGRGIATTELETDAPERFDINGDGFANPTGWIGASQGFLVHLDTAPDGQVTSIKQLFGSATVDGFQQLASWDTNGDGIIDAQDAGWASLRIWRDLDGNHQVGTGELVTLDQAGIASISLSVTPLAHTFDQGNQVRATAAFMRTDGTTGTIADVALHTDNFNGTYLGAAPVSDMAALLPEVRGYGTLLNLRASMTRGETPVTDAAGNSATVPSTLETVAQAALAALPVGGTMDDWRAAMLPVLTAWTAALPDPKPPAGPGWWTATKDADGQDIQGAPDERPDVWLVLKTGSEGNVAVDDLEYTTETVTTTATDPQTGLPTTTTTTYGYWMFGSGRPVTDAAGVGIVHPTLDQARATPLQDGERWSVIRAPELDFMERFLGEALPLGQRASDHGALAGALTDVYKMLNSSLDMVTLRFAVQAPALSQFFGAIRYDAASDSFSATTDMGLVPLYRAIFAAAPAGHDAQLAYLSAWRTILADLIPSFVRANDQRITDSYMFANVVAGWEAAPGMLTLQEAAAALGGDTTGVVTATGAVEGGAYGGEMVYVGPGVTSVHDRIGIQGNSTTETYVVGASFGHAVIDQSEGILAGTMNILRFASLRSTDIAATRDGTDLVLSTLDGAQSVRIKDQFVWDDYGTRLFFTGNFADRHGVTTISFADGVTWDGYAMALATTPRGTHDQVLTGTSGTEILIAGPNDTLDGGGGKPVYVIERGSGHSTIQHLTGHDWVTGKFETMVFGKDITPDDLDFERPTVQDLLIRIKGTGDSVLIVGQFNVVFTYIVGTFWTDRVDLFAFANGKTLTADELMPLVLQAEIADGASTVYGYAGDDYLDAGPGDRTLVGGQGHDTYVFGRGYGHQIIDKADTGFLDDDLDVLQFGPGIALSDLEVRVPVGSEDLVIRLRGTDDTVTVLSGTIRYDHWFPNIDLGWHAIPFFKLADGTTLTRVDMQRMALQQAAASADPVVEGYFNYRSVIPAGTLDRKIILHGADTVEYSDAGGNDTVSVTEQGAVLRLVGLNPSDVAVYSRPDHGFDIKVLGTGKVLTFTTDYFDSTVFFGQLDHVEFADGTAWTTDDIRLLLTTGRPGVDTLSGTKGHDMFVPGSYSHHILGYGEDTVAYDPGAGALEVIEVADYGNAGTVVLRLGAGITSSQIKAAFDSNGRLLLTDGIMGDQILVHGAPDHDLFLNETSFEVIRVEFADGTVLTREQLGAPATTGTAGADTIYGSGGADVFDGCGAPAGSWDYEQGNGGTDTFVFQAGYGQLDLVQSGYVATSSVLRLGAGITPGQVTVRSDSSGNLTLADGTPGDLVKIDGALNFSENGVEQVQFADGTTWSKADLILLATTGTADADTLYGSNGDDMFDGRGAPAGGWDYEQGNAGADTFVFNLGYGQLEVRQNNYGSGGNVLELGSGITPEQLMVTADGLGAICLADGTPGDLVKLDDVLTHYSRDVDEVRFTDGTVWTRSQLLGHIVVEGTPGADSMAGFAFGVTFDGKGAPDGSGDYAEGSSGADTFVFNPGYGRLEIDEYSGWQANQSVLRLGSGITPDMVRVTFEDYRDALITDGRDGDQIKIDQMLGWNGNQGISTVQFADGTMLSRADILNMATMGSLGTADVINGPAPNLVYDGRGAPAGMQDVIHGYGVGDTIEYRSGYGALEVHERGGSTGSATGNTLVLNDLGLQDVTISRAPNGDMLITDGAQGDLARVVGQFDHTGYSRQGVASLQFSDGTSLSAVDLENLVNPGHVITGSADADNLSPAFWGTAWAFDGLGAPVGSSDQEQGSGGADTFVFNAGYGGLVINEWSYGGSLATLQFGAGIAPGQVKVGGNGTDLILTDGVADDQVTLSGGLQNAASAGVGQVAFADGTVWTAADMLAKAATGTTGDDRLHAYQGGPALDGLGGDDYAQGISWGDSTFVFNPGYGHLEIDNDIGASFFIPYAHVVLQLGAGITPDQVQARADAVGNLLLTDGQPGDLIKIDGMAAADDPWQCYGLTALSFADGTVLTRQQIAVMAAAGTPGADFLYGTPGGEILDGKGAPAGLQDYAQGNGGSDTFVFNAGYGQLEVNEDAGYYASSAAVLQLGAGISPAEVAVVKGASDNVLLTDGVAGDQVKLDGMASTGYGGYAQQGVAQVRFSDGTTWMHSQVAALAGTGTAGPDTIQGTGGNDLFDGRGGGDTITGGGAWDVYFIRQGYGLTTVDNASPGSTVVQGEVDFGIGITEQNLWFSRSGDDLLAQVLGSADAVNVRNWFGADPSAAVSTFHAFGGLKLDGGQVDQLATAMASYAGSHPGFDPGTATAMPADPALQSALGAAWHG